MNTRSIAVAVLFCAPAALAQGEAAATADFSRPQWSASLQLFGLVSRAIGVEVERLHPNQRMTLVLSSAFRLPVSGDYSGNEWNLGAEGRFFVWRPLGELDRFEGGTPGGAFVLTRLDGGWLSLRRDDAPSADSLRYGVSLGAGYRFLPVWRMTLTPTAALGLSGHSPVGGTAAPLWAIRVQFGLSAGVLF